MRRAAPRSGRFELRELEPGDGPPVAPLLWIGSRMIEIRSIVKTCSACPAQWEGQTADGRAVYVRYRWGHLAISVSSVGGSVAQAVGALPILEKDIGDGLLGMLSYQELQDAAPEVAWPSSEGLHQGAAI